MEQLEPQNPAYNICRPLRLFGELDLAALQKSLGAITARHETLRTAFRLIDGRPRQIVLAPPNFAIASADLRAMAAAEREAAIQRRLEAEIASPFDLSAGRLLRATLLRVGDHQHVLILMTHHSVADAWSMGILTRELWTLYEAFSEGRPSPLEILPLQYSDYAAWQRDWLQSDVLDGQLNYWRTQLENLATLDLPSDRPRPAHQSFQRARLPIALPQSLTAALNDLASRLAVTPFMILLAALQILLYRYSGQEDIAVGSAVANRRRPEIEELIGFFVNTLVLRADLSGNPSFRELLAQVKNTCIGADTNQDWPFEKLVQELQPERDLSRNPLFQVMFVLQNATRPFVGIESLGIEAIELPTSRSPFDLSLFLRERGGQYIGDIEYSTELFERERIERMAGHFQTLLQAIVSDPDRSIASLPILSEAERRQLFIDWNDTAAAYPKDKCIHQLFEEQAAKTPDDVALEFEKQIISYRELNRRANQLAHQLINLGIGPEMRVGICVKRSIEMVVGLLAILKAGAAYVPLDPSYPRERLRFMLEDSQVSVLMTQEKLGMNTDARLRTVYLDRDAPIIEQMSGTNPNSQVQSENPAYVIYTSGSTGAPKGVVGLHRGAVNRFSWMWRAFPFGKDEKLCQKTSLSFVDSIWEIFGALLHGVPTVIAAEPAAREPETLLRFLAKHRITRIVVVPSLLDALLKQCGPSRNALPRLCYCFSSGEALGVGLTARFHKILPHCRLINLYGSSEVSADVTCYETNRDDRNANIAIGRPIANTQIFLLDSQRQPVPVGVAGELYVAGANLARGYWQRPRLTADNFIANPFGGEPNAALYRTGDLARYRADGNIEFLGRADGQIKIRGQRVELGEIESALGQHPLVKECVVVGDGATPSDSANPKSPLQNPKFLVAYFVAGAELPLDSDLTSFLCDKLPEVMIPQRFIQLDALPKLPNGKLDRQALAKTAYGNEPLAAGTAAPSSQLAELIAQVWRDCLGVESIGVDDNFFQLGGHSLLGAEVIAKLRAVTKSQLALRDLFEQPTVRGLVRRIEAKLQRGRIGALPPVVRRTPSREAPLTLSQERLFTFCQLFGGGDFLNLPYAYRISGALDPPVLQKALNEIIRRHEILRTGFSADDGRPVQRVRRAAKLKLSVVDLTNLPTEKRQQRLQRLSHDDALRTFDVEQAPLLRAKLIRLTAQEQILFLTLHHLVSDQWSMNLIRRELAMLYDAFAKGLPSPLAELPFQFANYADWQCRMIGSGKFNRQLSYWIKQLAGGTPPARFPCDRDGQSRFQSAGKAIEFDDRWFAALRAFARRQQCTPFMIFLAALDILLYRLTGQEDLRIGTLTANRSQPGTERLVGYFVNALVLRTRLSAKWSGAELLRRVRATCLAAYAHQDLPFERLEAALAHESQRDQEPAYRVMLNYRNQSETAEPGNGITIARWDGKNRAGAPAIAMARLDLSFEFRETSNKLTGAVNFKTDLFDDEAMTKAIAAYQRILTQLIADPAQSILRLTASLTDRARKP